MCVCVCGGSLCAWTEAFFCPAFDINGDNPALTANLDAWVAVVRKAVFFVR